MNILDLFSGIGGFSLGLERAGMKTVAFCEVDKHCQKVLNKHWPGIPIFDDVKKLKKKHINQHIDVVCGGFPCQDISVAGQKKGIKNGNRSGLWKEFARIIKEVKPQYAIIENVANLRNLGLNQVIKDLWSIGFRCEWHIISARSVGAPHLRERVWIIAYPKGDTGRLQQKSGKKLKETLFTGKPCENGETSDTDMPRFWKAFASEESQSEWWTKTTASFRGWWKIESGICRVDDGLPRGLDKNRKERIKQLGNSVVPQIPELIGMAILEYENNLHQISL